MSRTKQIVIAVVVAALIIGGYTFTLLAYGAEASSRSDALVVETQNEGNDYVAVDARVVSIDAVKNEATVRLAFTPNGSYADGSGKLTQDVTLTVDTETGNTERPFAKGKQMNPSDVVLGMGGGEVTDFPFDSHSTTLDMLMTAGTAGAATTVPIKLTLTTAVHGFSVSPQAVDEASGEYLVVNIDVHRASSTVFFAMFVVVLQWALALGALCVAWRVVVHRLKPELAMFTFMTAMLFAFPAIRNAVPGGPPIGALMDFMALFWAEVVVALSLAAVLLVWLFRTPPPAKT